MLDLLGNYLNTDVLRGGLIQNYERIIELVGGDNFYIPMPLSIQLNFTASVRDPSIVVVELSSEDDYDHHRYTEYLHSINTRLPKEEIVEQVLDSLGRIHYCDYCKSFKVFRTCYMLTDRCVDCYEASMLVIPGDCPICLEPIGTGIPFVLECSHTYHQKCIMRVDAGRCMIKCPVCRKQVEFYNWTERYSIVRKAIAYNK